MGVVCIRRGLMTPRFALPKAAALAAAIIALLVAITPADVPAQARHAAASAPASTIDHIRQAGRIALGYATTGRPFAFRNASGAADGYAVAVCQKVVDAIRIETGMATLPVEWVPVTREEAYFAVQRGRVDLLCGAPETLAPRQDVAFSIPIFPGGIGALLRADAPSRLQDVLMGRRSTDPGWRANAGQLIQTQRFTVVAGSHAQTWLAGKLNEFQLTARVVPVTGVESGVQQLLEQKADVFFANRDILLDALAHNPSRNRLMVLDRYFTYETLGLALRRGDEGFRLTVDRALSRLYPTPGFRTLYATWFGAPSSQVETFFRWTTLPE